MNNLKNFIINDGVLERYYGNDAQVEIPGEVTSIGREAFLCCSSIKNLTLPEGLTEIGQGALYCCKNLSEIEIPEGARKIGKEAFISCSNLKNVTIPETVSEIDEGAFDVCTRLVRVSVPEGITEIRKQVFNGCAGLKHVDLPDTVTSIGDWAFRGCESLPDLKIPEGVTSIGAKAFEGCRALDNLKLPESLESAGDHAFDDCSLQVDESIADWSEEIFRSVEGSRVRYIYGPDVSIDMYPSEKLKNLAVKGFLKAGTEGGYFNGSTAGEYVDYIRSHEGMRREVYSRVTEDNGAQAEWYVRFLVDNRIIPLDEFNQVLDLVAEVNDPALTAAIMEYKEKNFTEDEIDDFDDSEFDL